MVLFAGGQVPLSYPRWTLIGDTLHMGVDDACPGRRKIIPVDTGIPIGQQE
jgi:hypothetical protein